jgi:uncharacterized protein (TIGR03437 family)
MKGLAGRVWLALCLTGPGMLHSQYTITRVAGGINGPTGMAADNAGNIYVAEAGAPFTIRQVNQAGVMTIVAGGGNITDPIIGQSATSVGLTNPNAVAVDLFGNFYISEGGGGPILRVTGGIVYQVNQTPGGYDGLAADPFGNLFYGTTAFPGLGYPAVYKTVAVTSQPSDGVMVIGGSYGCGGGAIWDPYGLAADAVGNLYVADAYCNVIWKVTPSGTISVAAGVPGPGGGPLGDGGPATAAHLFQPHGVAVDAFGNIYITEGNDIRQVNTAGIINTIAGNGNTALPTNPGCATATGQTSVDASTAVLGGAWGIAAGPGGVYFADHNLGVVCRLNIRTFAWSWGDNTYGGLGNGTTTNSSVPTEVSGLTNIMAIASGGSFSMALTSDGLVWTWGHNQSGQLGNGSTTDSSSPVKVSGLGGVVAIAAGTAFSLALKNDGTVWAWGYNGAGQVGDGTTTDRSTPVQVSGLTGVTAIAAGEIFGLALLTDGTVRAWGNDDLGQLGNNSGNSSSVPMKVQGLSGVTAIAAGFAQSLALKSDGSVWAWGDNSYGELGNGTNTSSGPPVQVSSITGAIAVSGGSTHSLALKSEGTVWAWGDNRFGELGNGTNTSTNTPVQVSGLTGITAIAGGSYFSLALMPDGTVSAWGQNAEGQLGTGSTAGSAVPVPVSGLSGVTAIAANGASGSYPHSVVISALSALGGIITEALGVYPPLDDLNTDGQINVVDIQIDIERALGWIASRKPPSAQKSIVPKAPAHTPFHPDPPAASSPTPVATRNFLPPTATSVRSVDGQPVVATGSWALISGAAFVPSGSADWSESIRDGSLPASLDGVTVSVAGRAAYLAEVRPNRVSFLMPDAGFGLVPVTVTTPAGITAPVAVQVQPFSPAFFSWPDNQAVATHEDSSPAAKNGTFPESYTVPAKPGEGIVLWATGFGPTVPPVPAGVPVPSSPPYDTVSHAVVTIGGLSARGLSSTLAPGLAGVYRLEVEVPRALPNGDYPVIAYVNGLSTLPAILTVHD